MRFAVSSATLLRRSRRSCCDQPRISGGVEPKARCAKRKKSSTPRVRPCGRSPQHPGRVRRGRRRPGWPLPRPQRDSKPRPLAAAAKIEDAGSNEMGGAMHGCFPVPEVAREARERPHDGHTLDIGPQCVNTSATGPAERAPGRRIAAMNMKRIARSPASSWYSLRRLAAPERH